MVSQMISLLQANAKKVGLEIKQEQAKPELYMKKISSQDFELALLSLAYPPVPNDMNTEWHSKSTSPNGMNICQYDNPICDTKIDSIQINEITDAQQIKLLQEVEDIILSDAAIVPIVSVNQFLIVHKRIKKITYTPYISPFFLAESIEVSNYFILSSVILTLHCL